MATIGSLVVEMVANTVRIRPSMTRIHARVVRRFGQDEPILFLEKSVWLASSPTSGTRLDLTKEGVPVPRQIVTVMLSPRPDRPGAEAPAMELHTEWEPRAAAEAPRTHGWRHRQLTVQG